MEFEDITLKELRKVEYEKCHTIGCSLFEINGDIDSVFLFANPQKLVLKLYTTYKSTFANI